MVTGVLSLVTVAQLFIKRRGGRNKRVIGFLTKFATAILAGQPTAVPLRHYEFDLDNLIEVAQDIDT